MLLLLGVWVFYQLGRNLAACNQKTQMTQLNETEIYLTRVKEAWGVVTAASS